MTINPASCLSQLFPQIEEVMIQPLRESRDRYEELKQIDDAMNEVRHICLCLFSLRTRQHLLMCSSDWNSAVNVSLLQVQKKKSENLTMGKKK